MNRVVWNLWLTRFYGTRLICDSEAKLASDTRRTSPSLTPPAWQTVTLPGGSLAAVGTDTIAPLQAAWPKRAHLHVWTNANGQRIVRGGSFQHSASSVRVRQNATLPECCCTDSLLGWHDEDKGRLHVQKKNHIKAYRGWGKGWKVLLQTVQSITTLMICALVVSQIAVHLSTQLDTE